LRFNDIIGNNNIKLQLTIASEAARINNEAIPHTLFTGASGCGKTTMSKALAIHQGAGMLKVPSESLKTSKDVYELIEKLSVEGYTKEGLKVSKIKPTIIFLDEIHRLPTNGQESLGIAMEEHYIVTKNQYTGENWEMWVPQFTIIGATTLAGKLSKPFRDRFRMGFHFKTYNLEETTQIAIKHAEINKMQITQDAAEAIASRARGVPRIVVNLLYRVWDAVVVLKRDTITMDECSSVFNIIGIDKNGLLYTDIKYLKTMYETGVPLGLDTTSILLNESPETIQNSTEPYLIQQGLLIRTSRGRIISKKGVEYLKENGYIEIGRKFAPH